jgi:hypothetical protein
MGYTLEFKRTWQVLEKLESLMLESSGTLNDAFQQVTWPIASSGSSVEFG